MASKKIRRDHNRFRKIIGGGLNERLKKFIKTGHILKMRPNGKGKMSIPIPQIEQPHFRFGKLDKGTSRGTGDPDEVIDKEWEPGYGPNAGNDHGDAILVDVDVEDVLQEMEEQLKLPSMKPKESDTYEETEKKYRSVSKNGLRSLIHKKKTIRDAMKRSIAEKTWGKKKIIPGFASPISVLKIIDKDFVYRQWTEVKIPKAQALVVFGRDGSYSMDDIKCNVVSNLCFWIEKWIQRDYEKTDLLYLWHAEEAKEVSNYDFYHLRHGGGTVCSTLLDLLQKLIKLKYSPQKYNIFFFYFGDGDNIKKDNDQFLNMLLSLEDSLNMAGICQVFADEWDGSLRQHIDNNINKFKSTTFIRTTSVGGNKGLFFDGDGGAVSYDEQVDLEMKNAIVDLLGA